MDFPLLGILQRHVDLVRMLVERGADVSAQKKAGWSPLHLASCNGHVDVVLMLAEHGAVMSAQRKDRTTKLHSASGIGRVNVARVLITYGAGSSAGRLRSTWHPTTVMWKSHRCS